MSKLDEIHIELDGIGRAMSRHHLAVPPYQRDYAWGDDNVRYLFTDLHAAIGRNDSEYFLGSVVLIESENGTGVLDVVDGQQRLTTTLILLMAMRDYFYESKDEARARDIENAFLRKKDFRTQTTSSRLQLNANDNDFFQKRILTRPDSPERHVQASKVSHARIVRAAEMARDHIHSLVSSSPDPTSTLADWYEYVDSRAKIIWMVVSDYSSAFTLFETLNDRGLELAISDLLKNHLLKLSGSRMDEVKQRWAAMTGALEAEASEPMVVAYIRHLWASHYGVTREKDLYERMKGKIKSQQDAVDFATQLERNSRLYAAILNPAHGLWAGFGLDTSANMATLNDLRMEQIRPLILAVLDTFMPGEVSKTLKLMVSWSVRLLIVGGLGGGVVENMYSDLAMRVRSGGISTAAKLSDEAKNIPTDLQFRTEFGTARVSKANLARYYLRTLERQYNGHKNPPLVPNLNTEAVNLEHILPQTPSSAWSHIDAETAREYYNRLGNLTLMESRMNSVAGNLGFSEKKRHYASSAFSLTSQLSKESDWGVTEIEARQSMLADLAVAAWSVRV